MARAIIEIVAASCAVFGTVFYLFSMLSAWRFLRQPRAAPGFHPPVSILKPVRGADPHAYECFRSHCLLDYPEYELIFGVHDASDPAVALVERLQKEFPQRRIELVVCPRELGTNRKVSNLIQMLPAARYDHLLVNDGDIRVPPDYLRRIIPVDEYLPLLCHAHFDHRRLKHYARFAPLLAVAFDPVSGALTRMEHKPSKWTIERRPALGVSFRLHAPLPNPPRIFAIGLNYRDHAAESKMELPKFPVVFFKLQIVLG